MVEEVVVVVVLVVYGTGNGVSEGMEVGHIEADRESGCGWAMECNGSYPCFWYGFPG